MDGHLLNSLLVNFTTSQWPQRMHDKKLENFFSLMKKPFFSVLCPDFENLKKYTMTIVRLVRSRGHI